MLVPTERQTRDACKCRKTRDFYTSVMNARMNNRDTSIQKLSFENYLWWSRGAFCTYEIAWIINQSFLLSCRLRRRLWTRPSRYGISTARKSAWLAVQQLEKGSHCSSYIIACYRLHRTLRFAACCNAAAFRSPRCNPEESRQLADRQVLAETLEVETQLIAHDKAVYDIAFAHVRRLLLRFRILAID